MAFRVAPYDGSPSWPGASRPPTPSRWDRRGGCTTTGAWVAGTRPAMTIRGGRIPAVRRTPSEQDVHLVEIRIRERFQHDRRRFQVHVHGIAVLNKERREPRRGEQAEKLLHGTAMVPQSLRTDLDQQFGAR